MKVTELVVTQELARQVKLMIELRAIRDFAKHERGNAQPEDKLVWEHLYRVVLEGSVQTEQAIAKLLHSGMYHYFRDIPEL